MEKNSGGEFLIFLYGDQNQMTVKLYLEGRHGLSVLSTSNEKGEVNAVVFSKPHFVEDGTVAFLMRERLTYKNVLANPKVCYLFAEAGKYEGVRLYLTKVGEEQDRAAVQAIRRKSDVDECESADGLHLVYFRVDKILPLIGGTEITTCPHPHGQGEQAQAQGGCPEGHAHGHDHGHHHGHDHKSSCGCGCS